MAKRLNKNLVGGLTALAFIVVTASGIFMVLSLAKTDPVQLAEEAKGYEDEGDYEKARIYYARAFRSSPEPKYLVAIGNIAALSGDEPSALEAWQQAVTLDPSLVEAYENMLDIYLEYGRAIQIKETSEAILRVEEKNAKALHGFGTALVRLEGQPEGDREKGIENLEAAHEVAPEVFEYTESLVKQYLAEALKHVDTDQEQARGRITEALNLVHDLVVKHETPGKDAANARVLYAEFIASPFPKRYENLFLGPIDKHLEGKDRHAVSENLFQQAVDLAGDDDEVKSESLTELSKYWFRRSVKESDQTASKQYRDKAEKLAREAINTWTAGFSSYRLLSQIYARESEFEKSAQVCVERTELPIKREGFKAVRQKRERIKLLLFAAEQYIAAASSSELKQGSEERLVLAQKAESLATDAQAEVADADRHGQLLHVLGKIKLVQNKDLEALAYFERADKAVGTPMLQNYRFLGMLRFQNGQIGGAREALLKATRHPRADAQTWVTLAKVHLAEDEPEIAIIAADEALKRSPAMAEAIRVKVAANQRLGRDDLVKKDLAKIEGGEQSLFRARVLSAQGQYQEAYDMLKVVFEKDPTSVGALHWMGMVAGQIDKKQEVLAIAEKAAKADPENFALQTLAVDMNPDLNKEQRIEKLLGLIQNTPDEYLRAYRLAELRRVSDQPAKAIEQYEKAAQLIINKGTEAASRAGVASLYGILEKQLLLSVNLKQWDKVDAVVQTAIEQNIDGAHGMTFKGRAFLAQEQYDAAAEALKLALAEQPAQSEAWAWLGESHYRSGRTMEAQAAFTRSAEMNRENFMSQRRLAELAKTAGNMDEFNSRLDLCLKLKPDDEWVRMQELVRQEEKNPEEGIVRREVIRQKKPDDLRNLVQLAHLYQLTDNVEKATELYTISMQHPESVPGVVWRASRFYAEIGDQDSAFRVLTEAREREETAENKAVLLMMAGTLHRRFGDIDAAELQYRKAVDLDPGETTFVGFAEHYLAVKKYEDALEWLDKAIETSDKVESARGPKIRRIRFDTLLRIGDHARSAAATKEYRKRYPKDPAGYLLESETHFVLGKLDESISYLTRYLQANPNDPKALYRRAQHYISRQKWSAAVADLEDIRATNADALDYAPRILLSQAYDMTNRSDLAISELKTMYEEHPEHATICRQYYHYFIKHERFADAETVATALVNRDPENSEWLLYLGRAASELKDGVKALASYRSAAEKSDYDWRYSTAFLDACKKFKNFGAGIRFYEEDLSDSQRSAPLIYRYANLLVGAGRTDEAINAYRKSLVGEYAFRDERFVLEVTHNAVMSMGVSKATELFNKEPTDQKLHRPNQHILASLLDNTDRHLEAITVLESLISTSTDDAEQSSLYARKGSAASMMENYQLAKECYEKAIVFDPGNYFVLNNLAYLLADKLGKPEEAVPYAERAVQINSQPQVVDTLAWTLVELGEYGRAIGLLSDAVQRNLEFISGLVHLAEAYRRNGNFSDSIPLYEQALKLIEESTDPDDRSYRELAEGGLKKARDRIAKP